MAAKQRHKTGEKIQIQAPLIDTSVEAGKYYPAMLIKRLNSLQDVDMDEQKLPRNEADLPSSPKPRRAGEPCNGKDGCPRVPTFRINQRADRNQGASRKAHGLGNCPGRTSPKRPQTPVEAPVRPSRRRLLNRLPRHLTCRTRSKRLRRI